MTDSEAIAANSTNENSYGNSYGNSSDSQPAPTSSNLNDTTNTNININTHTNSGSNLIAQSKERQSVTIQNKNAEDPTHNQPQDLWSDILNSVKSQRAVPSKNLILLGEPSTGKSTLLSLLSAHSPNSFMSNLIRSSSPSDEKDEVDRSRREIKSKGLQDLGLSYGYFDVGEGELGDGEETIARLGIYKLSSSHPSYVSLLPLSLPSPSNHSNSSTTSDPNPTSTPNPLPSTKGSIETLKESLIIITLDWENPWNFLEQLRTWLDVVRELVNHVSSNGLMSDRERENERINTNGNVASGTHDWNREKVVLEEMMERLEFYIRSYTEPSSTLASTLALSTTQVSTSKIEEIPPSSDPEGNDSIIPINPETLNGLGGLNHEDVLPLGEGTLTNNWGVGIVVVCTKADTISRLEREKSFKEEQFDYIQQVLRTICLKYGAALFYTARSKPDSIKVLRSYILHRLFTPSSTLSNPNPNMSTIALGKTGPSFPFVHKASTIERETLIVPSGWDSFGKINALREGFDPKSVGAGWESDCEIEKLRRKKGILERNRKVEEELERELDEMDRNSDSHSEGMQQRGSAVRWFEDVVSDWKSSPPVDTNQNKVKPPNAQEFLSLHFSTLQKDEDPRTKFSRTLSNSNQATGGNRSSNVVGPMGSSALSLPSVEKVVNDGSAAAEGYAQTASASASASASGREDRVERERVRERGDKERDRFREGRDRESDRATPRISRKDSRSQRLESPALGSNPSSSPGSTSPGGPRQSEVLHDFFQSLLKPGGEKSTTPNRSDKDRERRGSSNTKSSSKSNPTSTSSADVNPGSKNSSNSNSTDANLSTENGQ